MTEEKTAQAVESSQNSFFIDESILEQDKKTLAKVHRKIDLHMVLFYSIVYLVVQIDKTNISNVAIINLESGHGIKKELGGLTSQQWAWVLSIFYYPYIFLEPLMTVLVKKFSPRIWQSRIMISWGIVCMCQAASKNYSGILATRFFLGLCEAGFYPSVLYHLGFWYAPRDLPNRIAFFYACGQLSGAVSGFLAYAIGFLDQKRGISGWQWVFIIEGIPPIVLGIYALFFLPNYPETAKFLSEEEKRVLIERMPKTAPTVNGKVFDWDQVKILLRTPHFYTYSFLWFCHSVGGWGISYVLPSIVSDLGTHTTAIAQLMTMPAAFITFFTITCFGFLVHRKYANGFVLSIGLETIQIVAYIVLITINSSAGKYAMVLIANGFGSSIFPILWPDRMRVVKGTSAVGLAIGITNAFASMSGLISTQFYQSKYAPDYHVSYEISIAFIGLAAIAIAITWWLVDRQGILNAEGAEADKDSSSDEN